MDISVWGYNSLPPSLPPSLPQEMIQVWKPSGYWVCMHIQDKCLLSYTCYLVRCPPSPFLFVTGVKKTHLATVLEAVSLALNSTGYSHMDLSGKHLQSLMDLACNQHSQVMASQTSKESVQRLEMYWSWNLS